MTIGLEKEERMIADFLKSLGPWNNSVVIGGGFAPIIYKLYLANHQGNLPVSTRDIDSLISRKTTKVSHKNIAKHLKDASFTPIFKNREIPATEAYVKEVDGCELEVEFLTATNIRGDKSKNVIIAGVVAQPLKYLELSMQKALAFITHSKETGLVVSPGVWMLHKGLTFRKRLTESKACKDLYGIWYVATQLGKFSEKAIGELHNLEKEYPKWVKTFQENISKWIENTSEQDWAKLEAQDPFGELKKLHFTHLMRQSFL